MWSHRPRRSDRSDFERPGRRSGDGGRVPTVAQLRTLALTDFLATAGTPSTTYVGDDRTLSPATQSISANGVVSRTLPFGLSGTLNATLGATSSQSLQGLPTLGLLVPAGDPFSPFGSNVQVDRYVAAFGPLRQTMTGWTAHLGGALNRDVGSWRMSLTGAYDHAGFPDRDQRRRERRAASGAAHRPVARVQSVRAPIRVAVGSIRGEQGPIVDGFRQCPDSRQRAIAASTRRPALRQPEGRRHRERLVLRHGAVRTEPDAEPDAKRLQRPGQLRPADRQPPAQLPALVRRAVAQRQSGHRPVVGFRTVEDHRLRHELDADHGRQPDRLPYPGQPGADGSAA